MKAEKKAQKEAEKQVKLREKEQRERERRLKKEKDEMERREKQEKREAERKKKQEELQYVLSIPVNRSLLLLLQCTALHSSRTYTGPLHSVEILTKIVNAICYQYDWHPFSTGLNWTRNGREKRRKSKRRKKLCVVVLCVSSGVNGLFLCFHRKLEQNCKVSSS